MRKLLEFALFVGASMNYLCFVIPSRRLALVIYVFGPGGVGNASSLQKFAKQGQRRDSSRGEQSLSIEWVGIEQ
jgi:hypothetical protein